MVEIRAMAVSDYRAVFLLFSETPGVTVRDADSYESIVQYLERNPGLSFVAADRGCIVGCVLCGHDGRRGYLHHLVVSSPYRGKGIAKLLVSHCVEALGQLGIKKSHVDVLVTNSGARTFWSKIGWHQRDDIFRYSFISSGEGDA